jgi:hypothetical protein
MIEKKFFVGMLALALALGMALVRCEDDSTDDDGGGGGGDKTSPFEGTWVSGSISLPVINGSEDVSSVSYTYSEITFTGTTFQSKATGGPSALYYCFGKGTFAYTDTTITCTPTHGYVGPSSTPNWISVNYVATETYTINDGAIIGRGAVFQKSN